MTEKFKMKSIRKDQGVKEIREPGHKERWDFLVCFWNRSSPSRSRIQYVNKYDFELLILLPPSGGLGLQVCPHHAWFLWYWELNLGQCAC